MTSDELKDIAIEFDIEGFAIGITCDRGVAELCGRGLCRGYPVQEEERLFLLEALCNPGAIEAGVRTLCKRMAMEAETRHQRLAETIERINRDAKAEEVARIGAGI